MQISVLVTPDRLKAVIECPAGMKVDVAALRQLLAEHSIHAGLVRETVEAIAAPHGDTRRMILAKGIAPGESFPGSLDPPLIEGILPRPIAAGQKLGRYTPPKLGRPGVGVDGKPVNAVWTKPPLALGRGLRCDSNNMVVAERDGMLLRDRKGELVVALTSTPEKELNKIDVKISDDGMQAIVDLGPGEFALEDAVRESLKLAGVSFGIDEAAIKQARMSDVKPRSIVLARGRRMTAGKDGEIEYLNIAQSKQEEGQTDRVDFHSAIHIFDVEPGDQLVRLKPASSGQSGINVKGVETKSKPGKDPDLKQYAGKGTQVDPPNPQQIVATAAGVCMRTKRGVVEVSDRVQIDGNVDMHSGSIDTKYPVVIKGDIKAGFSVKSGADITVGGLVEDARISAKGNLTVKGGIVTGKNRVKTHGMLSARFIDNREIKAKSVNVSGTIGNCTVLALDEVIARDIAGGKMICTRSVTCERLGLENGHGTHVQVGVNAFTQSIYQETAKARQALHAEVERHKQRCQLIAHRMKNQAGESVEFTESERELRQVMAERDDAQNRLEQCDAVMQLHEHMLSEETGLKERASIIVKITAFPGVQIKFGDTLGFAIHEQMARPTFRLKDGQIIAS